MKNYWIKQKANFVTPLQTAVKASCTVRINLLKFRSMFHFNFDFFGEKTLVVQISYLKTLSIIHDQIMLSHTAIKH